MPIPHKADNELLIITKMPEDDLYGRNMQRNKHRPVIDYDYIPDVSTELAILLPFSGSKCNPKNIQQSERGIACLAYFSKLKNKH
jgi:hypothetical protein